MFESSHKNHKVKKNSQKNFYSSMSLKDYNMGGIYILKRSN